MVERFSLLYRRGGLGDTLLTFPILELLKKAGKKLVAVGNTDYFIIAKELGWAIEVYSQIPNLDFESKIIISVDGNLFPFPKKREWIVDYYLRSLNLKGEFSKTLPLKPLDKSPLSFKAVVHPSSGSKKKNLSPEVFLKIEYKLKKLGYETIYLLGEADLWLEEHVKNCFYISSLLETARALKTAALFVGVDSGLSHLASYCGVRTYILYGPTDKLIWKPIGERFYQLSLDLSCSPCFPNVCKERPCLGHDILSVFDAVIS
ncbi:MAG: glycosyltransferase family 9 protein [Aquificaceae bacterium]